MRTIAISNYKGGVDKTTTAVNLSSIFTVNAIRSISDALRIPVPEWRILRTCVPGRMTNAEVLDANFPGMQFETVIHQSVKVGEGSWQWAPWSSSTPAAVLPRTTSRSRRRCSMASVSDVAKGFTISGLIDADARTRERFRVAEVPVAEIADRPAQGSRTALESREGRLGESRDRCRQKPHRRCEGIRHAPRGGIVVARYGRQAEPDGRISK